MQEGKRKKNSFLVIKQKLYVDSFCLSNRGRPRVHQISPERVKKLLSVKKP